MIEILNLSKRFDDLQAVNNVCLKVSPGAIVGFLGLNGAGKSTTMRLLAGYLTPDSGTARICGFDIVQNRLSAQACTGYLPEAPAGFQNLTVHEFLLYCGESRGFRRRSLAKALDRTIDKVQLRSALCRKMKELSKGWRQRAWLAQAILHDPPVLILDEPTDGLDPNQKDQVRGWIRSMAKEKTVIFSTHILEEAEEVADRVIVISNGQIVADDPITELTDANGRIAGAFRRLAGGTPTGTVS